MKKTFILLIVLLLAFDATILFAEQRDSDDSSKQVEGPSSSVPPMLLAQNDQAPPAFSAADSSQSAANLEMSNQSNDANQQAASAATMPQAVMNTQNATSNNVNQQYNLPSQNAVGNNVNQQANVAAQSSVSNQPVTNTAAQNTGTAAPQQKTQQELQQQLALQEAIQRSQQIYAEEDRQNAQREQMAQAHQLLRRKAFDAVKEKALPLDPSQIEQLHRMYDDTQQAAEQSARTPPTPTSTSMVVNLAPGTTPPVIRLSQGFVSSLVFIDRTGAAWPIEAYDLGNPQAFNIQWDKESNTLMVQALRPYTYGNLAVKLKTLSTPVMLTLIPGQNAVDYRVDLRVLGMGPNAKAYDLTGQLPSEANHDLLNVLDGVAPVGSKELDVMGVDAQAWFYQEKLYLRTRFKVLSPAWISAVTSADGMNAYEMQKAPMVLVSRYGKAIPVKIEGF